MNRGLARRPVFEHRSDCRLFLSLLARATRRFGIELHAFALLTTHFHLLLRSSGDSLSRAMGWVEQCYVLRFNRRRERDGPLFRGRFVSRCVETHRYWRVVVQYVDDNPVAAGLCKDPGLYPWGSRRHYARSEGPRWLTRSEIEAHVCRHAGTPTYEPDLYARCLPGRVSSGTRWVVERRLSLGALPDVTEVDLIRAAPRRVLRGLAARARLADGGALGAPLASPEAVAEALAEVCPPDLRIRPNRKSVDGRRPLLVGLLQAAACLTRAEIRQRTGLSYGSLSRCLGQHRVALERDETYRRLACRAARRAIGACGSGESGDDQSGTG